MITADRVLVAVAGPARKENYCYARACAFEHLRVHPPVAFTRKACVKKEPLGTFNGSLFLGSLFDTVVRKAMIAGTLSAACCCC